MRLADFIQVFEPVRDERSAGVTIDVAAGIVAGLALVLALLLLSATMKTMPAQASEAPGAAGPRLAVAQHAEPSR